MEKADLWKHKRMDVQYINYHCEIYLKKNHIHIKKTYFPAHVWPHFPRIQQNCFCAWYVPSQFSHLVEKMLCRKVSHLTHWRCCIYEVLLPDEQTLWTLAYRNRYQIINATVSSWYIHTTKALQKIKCNLFTTKVPNPYVIVTQLSTLHCASLFSLKSKNLSAHTSKIYLNCWIVICDISLRKSRLSTKRPRNSNISVLAKIYQYVSFLAPSLKNPHITHFKISKVF